MDKHGHLCDLICIYNHRRLYTFIMGDDSQKHLYHFVFPFLGILICYLLNTYSVDVGITSFNVMQLTLEFFIHHWFTDPGGSDVVDCRIALPA